MSHYVYHTKRRSDVMRLAAEIFDAETDDPAFDVGSVIGLAFGLTAAEVYNVLVEDADVEMRARLDELHDIEAPHLDALARDNDWRVRTAVAANTNTAELALLGLTSDELDSVRAAVAHNPATPVSLLVMLAGSTTGGEVHRELCENPNTPLWLLVKMRDALDEKLSATVLWCRVNNQIHLRERNDAF